MKTTMFFILTALVLGCSTKEKEHKLDPMLLEDTEGRLTYDLRCDDYCDSDSQISVMHIYDIQHKLSYVQEIKGKKVVNSVAIVYCGNENDKKWLAGYYIFKEYFDNNLMSADIPPSHFLYNLDSTVQLNNRFVSFVDSTMRNNFAIQLDTCELNNLLFYVNITRNSGRQ